VSKYLITIGTFDGVHRGHQKLARWAINKAKRMGLKSRAVFFVAPPRFYLKPELKVPLLTSSQDRRRILKEIGFDAVEVLRFGKLWAEMPHTRFFEEYLVRRWRAGGLLVGKDFAFGRGRKGDLNFMQGACEARDLHLGILPLVRVGGRKIGSSRIRELLLAGDVRRAAAMLGRPHFFNGLVVRGRGVGGRLGFPTANLRVASEILTPAGVFAVRVTGGGLKSRKAVCNIGFRPTLRRKTTRLTIEVHVPGYSGSLYGKKLKVELIRRLRGEKKFPSLAALQKQIAADVRAARR
jgi:riboflavin kinase/FMN adenylyltransferase